MRRIVFVSGGARSGKSSFALKQASATPGKKAYIATAEALDEEMQDRIERHRSQRDKDWDTFEEPLRVADVIEKLGSRYDAVILDCLTLWLSNIIQSSMSAEDEIEGLLSSLLRCRTSIFVVSNEVGMGIVPGNEIARKFRDLSGFLNQRIAEAADEVYLVVSGIPMRIKGGR